MACPYAEKRGGAVYCKLIGRKVNPLAYPCLSNKYEKCKIYRKHASQAGEERPPQAVTAGRPFPPRVGVEIAKPAGPERTAAPAMPTATPSRGGTGRTRGLTLEGKPASNCLECIYYGRNTGICLLLGVEVRDPYDPPCAKT